MHRSRIDVSLSRCDLNTVGLGKTTEGYEDYLPADVDLDKLVAQDLVLSPQ